MTRGNSTSVPAKLRMLSVRHGRDWGGEREARESANQSVSMGTRSLDLTWFPGVCDRLRLAQFRTPLVSLAAEERGNTGEWKDGGVLCSAIVFAIS